MKKQSRALLYGIESCMQTIEDMGFEGAGEIIIKTSDGVITRAYFSLPDKKPELNWLHRLFLGKSK